METKRTMEQLKAEYGELCAKAGHLNYQIRALEKDLEQVYELLFSANLEAAALASKPKEEAKS
jgi:hypothetical protein